MLKVDPPFALVMVELETCDKCHAAVLKGEMPAHAGWHDEYDFAVDTMVAIHPSGRHGG